MPNNNRNKFPKSTCVKQSGIVECKNNWCNRKIYVSNPDIPHHCAICSDSIIWVAPGNVVPAKCYTDCANCDCQFKVKSAYYGKAPFCPGCRPLKQTKVDILGHCGYNGTYKNHVIHDVCDMWNMCEVCREELGRNI